MTDATQNSTTQQAIPRVKPAANLIDLPDNILLHLLEICPQVTILTRACRKIHTLWSLPSVRTNWLLRVSSSTTQALDIAVSYFHDYELAINLLHRCKFNPLWLAHVLVDHCRNEPPRIDNENMFDHTGMETSQDQNSKTDDDIEELLFERPQPNTFVDAPMLKPIKNTASRSETQKLKNIVLFPKLIQALIDSGADLNANITLYLKSLLFGSFPYNPLLTWIVNESHQIKNQDITVGDACLFFVAAGGHHEACRILLKSGKVNVSTLNDLPLCVACRDGRTDVVNVLLEYGANPAARDGLPMSLAKKESHIKILEIFSK